MISPETQAPPTQLTSTDLYQCRLLLQRHLRCKELEHEQDRREAGEKGFKQGFESGYAAHEEARQKPRTPFIPRSEALEGTKTLLANSISFLLVGWMFQFFVPMLQSWPSALVVLEIVRGPLKVGGDFAHTAALNRAPVQIDGGKRLRFAVMYAGVLAAFAVAASVLTQVGSNLISLLTQGLPLRFSISLFDLVASGGLAFVTGCVALYIQGFLIVPWVRDNVSAEKRNSWFTTTRSYARMATNYFLLFALAAALARFR